MNKSKNNPFGVGDIVRLRRGWTALKVVDVIGCTVFACYTPSAAAACLHGDDGEPDQSRHYDEFVPWDDDTAALYGQPYNRFDAEKEDPMQLYTWNTEGDEALFGTKIATNSNGDWVMEIKGTSQVAVIAKGAAEIVLPYSVAVTFADARTDYHYWAAKAADLAVGDRVLRDDGQIVIVTALDTQSRKANKWLEGFKLTGVALAAGG